MKLKVKYTAVFETIIDVESMDPDDPEGWEYWEEIEEIRDIVPGAGTPIRSWVPCHLAENCFGTIDGAGPTDVGEAPSGEVEVLSVVEIESLGDGVEGMYFLNERVSMKRLAELKREEEHQRDQFQKLSKQLCREWDRKTCESQRIQLFWNPTEKEIQDYCSWCDFKRMHHKFGGMRLSDEEIHELGLVGRYRESGWASRMKEWEWSRPVIEVFPVDLFCDSTLEEIVAFEQKHPEAGVSEFRKRYNGIVNRHGPMPIADAKFKKDHRAWPSSPKTNRLSSDVPELL